MLYILKSAGYDEEGRYIALIKIGFTDNWDRRHASYVNHNPTILPLYMIDDGTMDDEYNLCQYFKRFQYNSYGNEWFYYSQEIIDFFSANQTVEKIREAVPSIKRSIEKRNSQVKVNTAKHIMEIVRDFIPTVPESFLDKLLDPELTNISQTLCLIRDIFPDKADEIIDRVIEWYCIKSKIGQADCEIYSEEERLTLEFMNKFDSVETQKNKMKVLCTSNVPESVLPTILNQVPVYMKKFYISLGPNRCRALSYDYTKIMSEILDQKVESSISDRVYQGFEVGDRISKASLKQKLGELYKNLNYSRTAKAADITKWFEVKRAQIKDPNTGKIVEGFELLARKQ